MSVVVKANQRGNGRQLAAHLLNAHDNETVEMAGLRGAIASDLSGALDEWHALSKATKCKKFLYHLSINPDPAHGPLSRAQYADFIERVEKKLHLNNQPRAVAFHIKEAREHCHVVWSRIDPLALKAVPISHDRKALQAIIRGFARDHDRPIMRKPRSPQSQATTLAEKHQDDRTGQTKNERTALLTRIWEHTTDGPTFIKALAQKGYRLARGEKAPYVVIDPFGEIHSLPRQIEGVRTKDIRARLKDLSPEDLPPAKAVRETVLKALHPPATEIFNRKAKASWTNLKQAQHRRRVSFKEKTEELRTHHREARATLIATQKEDYNHLRTERLHNQFGLFTPILLSIPGLKTLITNYNKRDDKALLLQYRQERQALIHQQKQERDEFTRQARAITRVEKREQRSLKTDLRREYLQATVVPTPVPLPAVAASPSSTIAVEFNALARVPEQKETIRDSFNAHAAPPHDNLPEEFQPRLALG